MEPMRAGISCMTPQHSNSTSRSIASIVSAYASSRVYLQGRTCAPFLTFFPIPNPWQSAQDRAAAPTPKNAFVN